MTVAKNVSTLPVPAHIAIIMDGNGRWAKARNLPRSAGHIQGARTFEAIARYCRKIGVRYLTVFAFSTENKKRPASEVAGIFALLRKYLADAIADPDDEVRIRFIGSREGLPADVLSLMEQAEAKPTKPGCFCAVIALNYGGRDELAAAARQLVAQAVAGRLDPAQIDEHAFAGALYTAGLPDPDFILRPSGEKRLSNFLLWQAAYTELIYMDVLWPDFTPAHLDEAIREFARRDRRYGGI